MDLELALGCYQAALKNKYIYYIYRDQNEIWLSCINQLYLATTAGKAREVVKNAKLLKSSFFLNFQAFET